MPVQCLECGVLAWRHAETGELNEVPFEWRGTKHDFGEHVAHSYASILLCLARQETFPDPSASACRECVGRERECDAFMRWQPGFTPKEHMEMRLSKELIESEQKWRETQADRERRWREEDVLRGKADMAVKILIPICTTFLGIIGGALATWFVKDAIQPMHSPTPPTSTSAALNPPATSTPHR